MGLKNTNIQYGSVAKWMHWITALCFLCAYAAIYYVHWFTEYRSPEYREMLLLHAMFGLTVGILFLPRLIWRLINVEPEHDPAPHWQHLASKIAHWILYLFIFAMPLTGWLGFGMPAVNFYGLFDIPTLNGTGFFESSFAENMGLVFEEWEKPIDFVHVNILGRLFVWMLILVHVAAALYHHFVQKDNTLRKMVPGMKPK
jgi:cytochrome b561